MISHALRSVESNEIDIVGYLLSAGGSPNLCDSEGRTALYWAVSRAETDFIELVIDQKADITMDHPNDGYTALHHACDMGYDHIVEMLLEMDGISCEYMDSPDNISFTPLMYAADHGWCDIAVRLLRAGADINRRDERHCGDTALKLAVSAGDLDMTKLLMSQGADPIISGWMCSVENP